MYRHLLIATDGSELSAKAVAQGLALAQAVGARVTAFYAAPEMATVAYEDVVYRPVRTEDFVATVAREAERALGPVKLKAEAAGVACDLVHTVAAAPWEAIIDAATRRECDCIVMASHGRRGVSALLLGSETQKVLTHTRLPVLVVR